MGFWSAMSRLLGDRWVLKHGAVPSREWRRLLARYATGTPGELAARIVKQLQPNARGEVWPPEMADVIAMARPVPADFGLPTVLDAYRDAVHSRWGRHAVVYEAARRLGTYELRHWTEQKSRPAFEREYAHVCQEWMAGARFDAPVATQIEHQKPQKATPETASHYLARMRAVVGGAT